MLAVTVSTRTKVDGDRYNTKNNQFNYYTDRDQGQITYNDEAESDYLTGTTSASMMLTQLLRQ